MKKILAIAAAAITCAGALAIEWGSVENLAQGATATVSSRVAGAQNIITEGGDWQADPATHSYTQDWALIDLGEVKTFTDMQIKWEASHCKQYSVYVSTDEITYTHHDAVEASEGVAAVPEYNEINIEGLTPAIVRTDTRENIETNLDDDFSFETPQTGRYILIYADEYNNFGSQYGIRIYQVRLANVEGRDNPGALQVNDVQVKEGENAELTVSAVTVGGDAIDVNDIKDVKFTCSDPEAVEITAGTETGKYNLLGKKAGNFTLTTEATVKGQTMTCESKVAVTYVWRGESIITPDMSVRGRFNAEAIAEGETNPTPAANAIDGVEDTYYAYNTGWSEGWVIVDLGKDYIITEVAAQFADKSGGNFNLSFAREGAAMPADDDNWKTTALEGWTNTKNPVSRSSYSTSNYVPEETVIARYVAYRDFDCPNGNAQLAELYVAGEEYENPHAETLIVTTDRGALFIGEEAEVAVTAKDQYGEDFTLTETPQITVTGATYEDGKIKAAAKGVVTVKAELGDLSAETSFNVADTEDYCMTGATVTSDNADANGALAIDGGKDPDNNGGVYVIVDGEAQGPAEHWILAELDRPYNLDMIVAIWEGACPADYKVFVGETADDLREVGEITGRSEVKTWNDRFAPTGMTDVKYIKIVTTKNATGYGIKLHDLKAYGTSDAVSVPTTINIKSSDNNISTYEPVTLITEVLDQFGAAMEDQTVTFDVECAQEVVENKGAYDLKGNVFQAHQTGKFEITAKCGEIESETLVINALVDNTAYFFPSWNEGETAPVTIKFGDDVQPLEMSNNVLNNVTKAVMHAWSNDDIAAGKTLSVRFNVTGECDLDMILFRWERACPTEFEVRLIADSGNEQIIILSSDDREFSDDGNAEVYDRVIDGDLLLKSEMLRAPMQQSVNMSHVKEIVITPKSANSQYGAGLRGMYLFGKAPSGMPVNVVEHLTNDSDAPVDVYSISGTLVRRGVEKANALEGLAKGVYIVGGKKVVK